MSTGGLGLAQAQGYLKTYYMPDGLWNEIISDSPLLANMKAMGKQIPITGEQSEFSIQHSRQSGIKISNETSNLPGVNPRKNVKGWVSPKQIYGRTSVDQFTMATTKNNFGAYLNALTDRFDTLVEDMGNAIQLQVWTDTNAFLSKITGSYDGATALDEITVENVLRFEPGVKINLYALDANKQPTGSKLETFIVLDYDIDNDKIFLDKSFSFNSGTNGLGFVFNSEGLGMDVEGLEGQMKSASEKSKLHNIDRTDKNYKFYQASSMSNASDPAVPEILDENILRKAKSRSELLTPKKRNYSTMRRVVGGIEEIDGYESTLKQQRRYNSDGSAPDYDTGKASDELYFDNILLEKDKYAKKNEVEMLNMASWNLHVLEDQSWMDMDGSIFHRIADKPGYEGTSYMYWNMSNKNPRENVKITGVLAYEPTA